MNMRFERLNENRIGDLVALSKEDGFPYVLSEDTAKVYCRGKEPVNERVQTYGAFADGRLVGVMTATFCTVFPCEDSPRGRIVHISGAFTLPAFRHRRLATALLELIEADAEVFGADYLCCDSTADGLYRSFGFQPAPEHETRMWKCI